MNYDLQLVAAGQVFTGWEEVEIARGLDACASSFRLVSPERFARNGQPVPFGPFTPVQLRAAGQPVLTGHTYGYSVDFDADSHRATIMGRSKTALLVDCTPDVPAGQYQGYSFEAIVRAVTNIWGITPKINTNLASTALADATLERSETAFRFLDRYATISGVLIFDDETGALVVDNAGDARANGALKEGVDKGVMRVQFSYDCSRRYSTYIVKGQAGLALGAAAGGFGFVSNGAGGVAEAQAAPPVGQVLTQQRAVANDPGVPLYRPKIIIAEGQLTQSQLQLRANWQRSYAYGHALHAEVTVPGWFQPDGTLWKVNTLVPVDIPSIGTAEDLLILKTVFKYSTAVATTELTIGPVDGAIPSPNLLKTPRRRKGKRGGAVFPWSGVVSA